MLCSYCQTYNLGADIEIIQQMGSIFVDTWNKLLVQSAFLCSKGGHFLVVERDSKFLCNHSPYLLSGGAVLTSDCNNHSRLWGANYTRRSFVENRCVFNIWLREKLTVEQQAYCCGYHFRYRECQPEPEKSELRKDISQWNKQYHGAHHGQKRAFQAGTDRLKEYGENQRGYQRNKAASRVTKTYLSNRNHCFVIGEQPK